jgi:hypothetical protein
MAFNPDWLADGEDVPSERLDEVHILRAYLDHKNDNVDQRELVSCSPEGLLSLVERLSGIKDGARLEQIKRSSLPKAVRKLAGKSIHRLRTQGVTWTIPQGTTGTMAYKQDVLPSYMSLPSPTGMRFLILTGRHANGSLVAVYGMAHDTEGLENFIALPDVSRTRLKKLLDQIERPHHLPLRSAMSEADPALVRARFVQAAEAHRVLGKPFSEDYHRYKTILDGDQLDGEHPATCLVVGVDDALLLRGIELLGKMDTCGEHTHYHYGLADCPMLGQKWINEMSQRLENAATSTVVINEAQRRERIVAELDRIIVDTYVPEFRKLVSDRLLDAAVVMHQQNLKSEAEIAATTAQALLDPERQILDIPWARKGIMQMVNIDAILGAQSPDALEHDDEPTEDDTSLIISG